MKEIFAIALITYRESIRSKILYSVMVFALLLIGISAFFGTVTVGDQVRVIKDFGLFSMSIFTVAFAVISGAALLHKELSKKTVFNILAKPVYRAQFLLGKYVGMIMTTSVMLALMGMGLSVFLYFFEGKIDPLMFEAYLYIGVEILIVCAAAIFFSAIVVTPMLSGLFTFGIFLAGRKIEDLLYFVKGEDVSDVLSIVLKTLHITLPHLNRLNIGDRIVFGESVGVIDTFWNILYALGYAGVLLVLANWIFRKREFN